MPRPSSPLAFRVPEEIAAELEQLSQETGRSKSYYIREAIAQYLEERGDYLRAVARLEKTKRKGNLSLEQIQRKFGLLDD
jgi:RHH-type rel operon transcriptional repressor/antitoxin RelB